MATTEPWGAFQGRLPGLVRAIFKIRDSISTKSYQLCLVELLEAKDRGLPDGSHGLLRVARRSRQRFWVVNISSVLGMAHLFELGQGQWLVNTRIDLRTWNEFNI